MLLSLAAATAAGCTDKGETLPGFGATGAAASSSSSVATGTTTSSTGSSGGMGGEGGGGGMGGEGGGEGGGSPSTKTGTITVVVPFDFSFFLLSSFYIRIKADTVVWYLRNYNFYNDGDPYPPEPPFVIPLPEFPEGTNITAEIKIGYLDCGFFTRHAETSILGGKHLLLRLPIGEACTQCETSIECPGLTTCSVDACVDPFVSPTLLEEYTPDWANVSDCAPPAGGSPSLELEQYENGASSPLADGQTIKLVYDSYYNVYEVLLSSRMRHGANAPTMTIRATLPGLGITVPDIVLTRPFAEDSATGDCILQRYPIWLDSYVTTYSELLGQDLKLDFALFDPATGTSATTQNTVHLDGTL